MLVSAARRRSGGPHYLDCQIPIFANLARVCEEEQIAPKRQLPFCLQNLFSASLSYELSEVVFLLSLTR